MKQFLKAIAGAYSNRYPQLSRLCFVMPNKRSGTFLLNAFSELNSRPVIAPRVMPVNEFMAAVSPLVADSRLDMIFRLFSCLRSLPESDPELTFEKFSSWGDVLVADFNEIDMQLADAEEIFKNVYDLNRIRSNFLSPRHRKVLVEYFGYSPEMIELKFNELWEHLSDFTKESRNETGGKARKSFRSLWQLLWPLYDAFKANLKKDGLTTPGGVYREVAESVARGEEPFPGEKLVFVGFNALSESENEIFSSLRDMTVDVGAGEEPKADFIWDLVSQALVAKDDPAARFVKANAAADNFPMPQWIVESMKKAAPEGLPEVRVIAVPSNAMQAKTAGLELQKMLDERKGEEIADARVAVVLPDENLLVPLLYSLPEKVARPNLTMGFPLRQTPVISFAGLLKKMQQGSIRGGSPGQFFFEDVRELLGHPYSAILFDRKKVSQLLRNYGKSRSLKISASILEGLGKNAEVVFRSFSDRTSKEEVTAYLLDVVAAVKEGIEGEAEGDFVVSRVEKTYLAIYTDALVRLSNCMGEYPFAISPEQVFALADKLIGGETVVFEGEPLQGLQVMGVLETRCLDFDTVIMLSVNEKSMPKVGRNSSFIPNIVRMAFGLPPANYQEEIFAYYFYRLIGRSRECILTYDSRASENRTPGPSRYLLQMKYLAKKLELAECEARFGLPTPVTGEIEVEKGEVVEEALRQYTKGEQRKKFSASALKHYFSCPLKFLFTDVLRLRPEEEKIESIGAADMGTIVHRAIERLYFPEGMRGRLLKSPLLMRAPDLEALLKPGAGGSESLVEEAARRSILEVPFGMNEEESAAGKLRGSAAILLDNIVEYVRYIVEADIRQAPFRLWGSEIEEVVGHRIPDGPPVRFKMVIDRLDQEGEEGDRPFRIVDYKTGDVNLDAECLEDVFGDNSNSANIFQLLLYAELFIKLVRNCRKKSWHPIDADSLEQNLKVVIYNITKLPQGERGIEKPRIETFNNEKGTKSPTEVTNIGVLREIEREEGVTFMELLNRRLTEILDLSQTMRAEPGGKACRFCEFGLQCEMLRIRQQESGAAEQPPIAQ